MSHRKWIVLLTAAALVMGVNAFAKGQEHGGAKGKGKEKEVHKTVNKTVVKSGHKSSKIVVFSTHDHGTIFDYYRVHRVKHEGLPPGLRKQLAKNGTLPPGLEKKLAPFPPELDHRLPVIPVYCRRGFIGYDVVVIDTRTNLILDIIHDVVHKL